MANLITKMVSVEIMWRQYEGSVESDTFMEILR